MLMHFNIENDNYIIILLNATVSGVCVDVKKVMTPDSEFTALYSSFLIICILHSKKKWEEYIKIQSRV